MLGYCSTEIPHNCVISILFPIVCLFLLFTQVHKSNSWLQTESHIVCVQLVETSGKSEQVWTSLDKSGQVWPTFLTNISDTMRKG